MKNNNPDLMNFEEKQEKIEESKQN